MAIAKSIQNYINSKKKIDNSLKEKTVGGQWDRKKRECIEDQDSTRRVYNMTQIYHSVDAFEAQMPSSVIV